MSYDADYGYRTVPVEKNPSRRRIGSIVTMAATDRRLSAASAKERAAARLLEEATRLRDLAARLPVDDFADGEVITFKRTFPGDPDKVYSYAAIKVDGRWYLTGRNAQVFTWHELLDWLGSHVIELCWTARIEELLT